VAEEKALVEAILDSAYHQASFLAASSEHSGEWLFALPIIASCCLRLDDEAERVAVGWRFDLDLCVPLPLPSLTLRYFTTLFAKERLGGQQNTIP